MPTAENVGVFKVCSLVEVAAKLLSTNASALTIELELTTAAENTAKMLDIMRPSRSNKLNWSLDCRSHCRMHNLNLAKDFVVLPEANLFAAALFCPENCCSVLK